MPGFGRLKLAHVDLQGDDYVVECVMSPKGNSFSDVEVFTSYNEGKSNERTYLNSVSSRKNRTTS